MKKPRNTEVEPAPLLVEEVMELPEYEPPEVKEVSAITGELQRRDDLLETSLSQTIESEHNIKHVARELFSRKDIDLKSEVSYDEVMRITRLRFLADSFGVSNIGTLTNNLLSLRVSLKRKSRGELIQMAQTENRNQQATGFNLAKLWGGGQNNNP